MKYLYILYIDQIIGGTVHEHHASIASDNLDAVMNYADSLAGFTVTEWLNNGGIFFKFRFSKKSGVDIKFHIQKVDWVH